MSDPVGNSLVGRDIRCPLCKERVAIVEATNYAGAAISSHKVESYVYLSDQEKESGVYSSTWARASCPLSFAPVEPIQEGQ